MDLKKKKEEEEEGNRKYEQINYQYWHWICNEKNSPLTKVQDQVA